MKTKIQILVLMFSAMAFAQVQPSSLKSAMKEMSTTLKTITAQASDATKNQSSAALAAKFVQAAEQSKAFLPTSANDPASKAKYAEMMDQVIARGNELQMAFQSNDNTKATTLLNQLVQDKKDGHNQFRQ